MAFQICVLYKYIMFIIYLNDYYMGIGFLMEKFKVVCIRKAGGI